MHHSSLYLSLQLLFEKRLGHEIFHPWGLEGWFPENWKIGDPYGEGAINTATQFLTGADPNDGTAPIVPYRPMTFQEFVDTPINLMIATYPDHILPYRKLINHYHPSCKLISQCGNMWQLSQEQVNAIDGLMASIKPFPFLDKPVVFYHQEINQTIFNTFNSSPDRDPLINSYVNALNLNSLFQEDWKDFQLLKSALPRYEFHSFGGGCINGSLSQEQLAVSMKECQFAIQFKEQGDGYSHILNDLAACGTPVIFKSHQYKNQLSEKYLIHNVTGLDFDQLGVEGMKNRLTSLSNEEVSTYGKNIRNIFEQTVNYDREELEIRNFLDTIFSCPKP